MVCVDATQSVADQECGLCHSWLYLPAATPMIKAKGLHSYCSLSLAIAVVGSSGIHKDASLDQGCGEGLPPCSQNNAVNRAAILLCLLLAFSDVLFYKIIVLEKVAVINRIYLSGCRHFISG